MDPSFKILRQRIADCNILYLFSGGLLFGLLGSKTARWGRDPIVLLGFCVHIITYFLIFLNIPNAATFSDTTDKAYIDSKYVLNGFLTRNINIV